MITQIALFDGTQYTPEEWNEMVAFWNLKLVSAQVGYATIDELATKLKALELIRTSAFEIVGAGTEAIDENSNVSRNGNTGIGEPNPENKLDVNGNFKTWATNQDGSQSLAQAGDRIFQDQGLPQNTYRGVIMTHQNHPDMDHYQAYTFNGDPSAFGGFKMVSILGIRDKVTTARKSEVTAYVGKNNANLLYAVCQAYNPAGDYARIEAANILDNDNPLVSLIVGVGGLEHEILVDHGQMKFKNGLLNLDSYGSNGIGAGYAVKEGYEHRDGQTVGAPKKGLAIDENGIVQTVSAKITAKKELTVAQARDLNVTAIDILDAPPAGHINVVDSILLRFIPGGTAYDTNSPILVKHDGNTILEVNGDILTSATEKYKRTVIEGGTAGSHELVTNQPISVETLNDLGAVGDGTIIFYTTFEQIEL